MRSFSIILPVKNGGAYVKECVMSILDQTYTDFNLIILDNKSDDGTLEWLYSLRDPRIVIYPSEEALTIEENWARAKTIPKNEYMTLIGHDDILLSDYLSVYSLLIDKHPGATLYQSHFDYIDKDGKETRKCLPMDEVQSAAEFVACQMNDTINSTGTGYMMRSRDYEQLEGIPVGYPNLIFSDYELWIKLMMKGYKATSIKKCFLYREHFSVSRLTNGMIYQVAFEKYIKFLNSLNGLDPGMSLVIQRYGYKFLMSFCESLSHRLLKTPVNNRTLTVDKLIKKFNYYSELLIPGQQFDPLKVRRIWYAREFDRSPVHRSFFSIYKAVAGIKSYFF